MEVSLARDNDTCYLFRYINKLCEIHIYYIHMIHALIHFAYLEKL